MSHRLEIELTSERPDGTWTWRAAGAKQPKGELNGTVLPEGAKTGDVLRAEAEFAVDGIDIVSVLPPKAARKEPERVLVVGTRQDEPLVTTQLAPKGRGGGRRDRGDRDFGDRGDRRDRRGGPRGDRDGERPRRERSDRPRGPRPDPVPERPKPKRLRPGRAHRSAILDELAVEERPIAEQVLRGGVPAVREAIAKQNEQAKAENRPEIPTDQLVAMAEKLLPKLRAAEWRDKADAAIADLDELDLRDLRSVVVAADGNTRDEESRALLVQLQEGLARRVEQEQTNWIDDMVANLDAGRFVRALRLSSRPPKAGTPLPPELATRLISAVSEGLTPTVNQDLWAAAVDALAFSPVRNQVVPAGRPEQPSQALLDAVMRVGDRLPKLVEMFGLDPAEVAKAAKRRPRGGGRPGGKGAGPKSGGKGPKERAPEPAAGKAPATEAKSEPAEGDPGLTDVAAAAEVIVVEDAVAEELAEVIVVEDAVAEELAEEIVVEEAVAEELAEEIVVEEAVAEELAEEIVVEEIVVEEIVVEEAVAEELAEEIAAEAVEAEELAEVIAAERAMVAELAEEIAVEEAVVEGLAEVIVAEDEVAEELAEEIVVEDVVAEELAEEIVVEEAIAEEIADESATDEVE